eukprot:Blabericola_migrator_1__9903@NODE_5467_length_760_cov_3_582973_g3530_i0_p1_GENE_NODE_5467_length_760_cov_3_582973_g3530_i0NODE_5467_length_760_cov_3_582973_g3530_i0_p1_ORF_typecomplete_len100_score9_59_NODE_5467_length_760_cov_3_582973_g3530_i0235534
MPAPSSVTERDSIPPPTISIRSDVAPASKLFSMSSFSTEAGRSMTSPAAIWLATKAGSIRMVMDQTSSLIVPMVPLHSPRKAYNTTEKLERDQAFTTTQ